MPSAAAGNNAVQCAIPDLGNGSHSETMKQFLGVIDKKVRNMEKKKSKLDDYQARKNKGERLNQDQLEALSKYQEIINNLDFARELQKSFLALGQEVQKAVKKSARREQLQREEMEQRRLKTVLELQYLLDQLGEDGVRQDLKRPDSSGSPLLTDADLASFDEFYKLVGPDRDCDIRLTDQYEEASQHLWSLLEGRDKSVAGTTYKSLRETLDKLLVSGYFDRAESKQNGTCETEEKPEEQAVVDETAVTGEQPPEPEGPNNENYTEPVQVETTEVFFNRQFVPETTYSNTDKDQVEEWTVEAQMNSLQHHPPAQLASEPTMAVNQAAPSPATDPVVRKQVVQDLMAQMQGTYNFMQDSMLEFDGQALDPAIVSAQPMKALQTVDLQQMGGPSIHSEPRLPQTSTVSAPQESSQVFNMNAPVPPPTDGQADALKQSSQFPGGYGQGFPSQSENTVEQPEMPQERLQSVVGGFQPPDQVMPSTGSHDDPSAGSGFGPSSQSFYSSRGAPRGGPRNTRGIMNGYRGSSNGFRGGYEGYRAPFSNAPSSSGYGQTQFNASRDYSNSSYQREGYQQGYKRGTAQGSRGLSRANAQAMRS
ncbi:PREDICTED: caprin-1-like isoform X3 [Poecilia mexicana]|uniref:caprin-1-like isoform X3 n=1 Tax=Poecilia mexicana TaxID=48701 RepID=UPI00072E297B|nr:PREDICTED: caprin-1-like isoform X3 [Poecilia mexicana]XP_016527952.1 PREDICTED: caprin-1-like isoform X3 [Poecilia formosa]